MTDNVKDVQTAPQHCAFITFLAICDTNSLHKAAGTLV